MPTKHNAKITIDNGEMFVGTYNHDAHYTLNKSDYARLIRFVRNDNVKLIAYDNRGYSHYAVVRK